ncbi:hypothetical protein Tco_0206879, partial [Tanacetum coccineum]
TIEERGVFEAPSLTDGSEISEVDEQACSSWESGVNFCAICCPNEIFKKGINQLAITIDSKSDHLLDKGATVEDKGLVPVRGKMIANQLDGIWVSGGQALMRQPRARLGVIAYWLVLHLWLHATIL